MFHRLMRAYSMDLLKKKLRNTTGGNTTWGVFKAYAFFYKVVMYFRYVMDKLGTHLNMEDLIKEADKNNDGVIDYEG